MCQETQQDEENDVTRCISCNSECDDNIEIDNEIYCSGCCNQCEDCGDYTQHINDAINNRGNSISVCDNCYEDYISCSDCGEMINSNYSTEFGHSMICDSCYNDYYFRCDNCGDVYNNDDYSSDGFCCNCNESCDNIHDYGYLPELDFYGDGPYYMGVELEVCCNDLQDSSDYVINKLDDFVYLKEDSSIVPKGFEIVSHPATLEIHKEKWVSLLDNLKGSGLSSYSRKCCGLHIHANRSHLSQLTVAKILVFVNSLNNKDFIVSLAQRESTYAEIKEKTFSDVNKSDFRREAVNLCNDETIEFRIFKGNLKKEALFRALEFVEAIQKYCKDASLNEVITRHSFFDYVEKEKKRYPNLHSFCKSFNNGEKNESGE